MVIRAIVAAVASAVLVSASASPPAVHLTRREMAAMDAINAKAEAEQKREAKAAIQINALIPHIHTQKDSQRVVNLVVKGLGSQLPQEFASQKMETLVAEAEYRSVSEPNGLIPDRRIADAWNAYLDKIAAPKDQQASAALIYNLLDADYTTALQIWNVPFGKGLQTMPAIYAVAPNGKLRHGATALEAARVIDDLATMPWRVQAARNRLRKGILLSDWLAQRRQHPPPPQNVHGGVFTFASAPYPVTVAAHKYVTVHGEAAYAEVVMNLMNQIFAAQPAG